MKTIGVIAVLLVAVLVVGFWLRPSETTVAGNDAVTVFGTATYLQRIALPPEAVLRVRIEDVSLADGEAPVMTEVSEIFGDRQVPIPFTLAVPRAAIDANARYALRATISVGEQLRFTTDRNIPVLTHGALDQFDLLLVAVSASPTSPPTQAGAGTEPGLRGTEWRLIELNGQPVAGGVPPERALRLTLSGDSAGVSGFGGCNSLVGGFESSGDSLRFIGMAGTMMACDPESMERERMFHQALSQTTSYRIGGRRLTLLAGSQAIAQFEEIK